MSTDRAILSVKYLAAPTGLLAGRAVSGFLRYIQHRDHHRDAAQEVSGLLRYVGYRDRTSPCGQLFSADGLAGDLDRKALTAHVKRSLQHVRPGARPPRAVYRMVLSPEQAKGLDLKELARATMRQLERDAGPLPPWLAAVHRNTAHPHVHIVMAARRETEPGQFRTVMITRQRLVRMKAGLAEEMLRQREGRPRPHRRLPPHQWRIGRRYNRQRRQNLRSPVQVVPEELAHIRGVLRRLAMKYQLESERQERDRQRDRESSQSER